LRKSPGQINVSAFLYGDHGFSHENRLAGVLARRDGSRPNAAGKPAG
jgi:hypothetical protein